MYDSKMSSKASILLWDSKLEENKELGHESTNINRGTIKWHGEQNDILKLTLESLVEKFLAKGDVSDWQIKTNNWE